MSRFQYLLQRREGNVEHIILNRPDVRNAFNAAFIAELRQWADEVAADLSVRAVVLSGRGAAFCAGADLHWMSAMVDYSYEENLRDARAMGDMFAAVDALRVPVIAKVQGAALGGGCGLVAVADVVIADERSTFGFTEVKLGLFPAVIAPFVVAKIGKSAARELFTTGRRFDASHAQRIGLIHQLVGASDLDKATEACVTEVLAAAPTAIAAAKGLLVSLETCPRNEITAVTAAAIARQRVSEEGQEGMTAFLQKRRPRWLEHVGSTGDSQSGS